MRPGSVVAGRFEIERLAGSGGMAVVYRAFDREAGATIALKVLRMHEEHAARRLAREAETLASLGHLDIVRYVAHGAVDDELYLAMEWLDGETLADRLRRKELTIAETVALGGRVATGLSAAHAMGVVHRDIKPGNLMLVDGDPTRVKILDVGIVRRAGSEAQLTATGALLGTPGYMAPEQARGHATIDARTDMFALGCVLFKCLTGRAAFVGDDVMMVLLQPVLDDAPRVRDLRPEVPKGLDDLIARMLSKAPDERPSDGGAVAADLAASEEHSRVGPAVKLGEARSREAAENRVTELEAALRRRSG